MFHDVVIIGAGGAGMMCAIHAGRRGRDVLLLDHAAKIGGKILISGGGRCNFTNTGASPRNYVSRNPHFAKSALARYPSDNFTQMVVAHGIPHHEKKLGQLFCDGSAQAIVDLLRTECEDAGAQFRMQTKVECIEQTDESGARFRVLLANGESLLCESLIIATGGLSIPKIGATGFGYNVAKQFGLKLVDTAPALDGFSFGGTDIETFRELAGLSIDCVISANGVPFRENILFTHSGLSGPAALQASLHWYPGDEVTVNTLPDVDAAAWLIERKREGSKSLMRNLVSEKLPSRFAEKFTALYFTSPETPLQAVTDRAIEDFAAKLNAWTFVPSGTVGYGKAEVTRGGVDTEELSSKTMEARKVPGLHFIGEVVDVTGWLGGYNFQWAWASGWAAGQVV